MKFEHSAPSRDVSADYDEHAITVAPQKHEAAGVRAVMVSMQRGLEQMGALRTAAALARLNQRHGFDCPGCAWPDRARRTQAGRVLRERRQGRRRGGHQAPRHAGVLRRGTRSPSCRHSRVLARPAGPADAPDGAAARADHYEPIGWDDAFELIAEQLKALASPDEALFYTSGRTSNEAAFLYQLLVRCFGTNNLPDCSNMCHESSRFGADRDRSASARARSPSTTSTQADLIIIAGQNPGTNHPRMLSALEKAKATAPRSSR